MWIVSTTLVASSCLFITQNIALWASNYSPGLKWSSAFQFHHWFKTGHAFMDYISLAALPRISKFSNLWLVATRGWDRWLILRIQAMRENCLPPLPEGTTAQTCAFMSECYEFKSPQLSGLEHSAKSHFSLKRRHIDRGSGSTWTLGLIALFEQCGAIGPKSTSSPRVHKQDSSVKGPFSIIGRIGPFPL